MLHAGAVFLDHLQGAGGQEIITVMAIYMTNKVVPAGASGQGGGGDVADGGRLQGRGGHARAHEEHLWFPVDLFCGPWKMITSTEYIKQSQQQVLIT